MKRMSHDIPWKGITSLLVTTLALLLATVPDQVQAQDPSLQGTC